MYEGYSRSNHSYNLMRVFVSVEIPNFPDDEVIVLWIDQRP